MDESKKETQELRLERQKFKLHKEGYDGITKAIKDLKEPKETKPEVQKVELSGISVITLKGDKGDSPSKEELVSLITPLIPEPKKGDKGDSYILTAIDKKEIANNIVVPIVEKVIEKTETIIEKPITIDKTKTIVKEVAVSETADQIVFKLQSVKKKWLSIEAIDGDFNSKVRQIARESGGANSLKLLTDVNLSGLTQDEFGNYNLGSGGGGSTWGSITGTLSDQTDLQTVLNAKQETLVSGTNIKTINGTSLLGSGDISISGSVSDGDKGDITVSSSGTVWTIDNLAVTNAKINDVEWSKVTTTPTSLSGYGITDAVPYSGATGDVDLGTHELRVAGIQNVAVPTQLAIDLSNSKINDSSEVVSINYENRTLHNNTGTLALNYTTTNQFGFGTLSNVLDFTGLTAARTYTLPDASGTFLLDSALSAYVPYTGATANLDLGANNLLLTGDIGATGSRPANAFLTDVNVSSSGTLTFQGSGDKNISIHQAAINFHDAGGPAKISLIGATIPSEDTDKTITLPNATGIVALTSDIPSVVGFVTTDQTVGQTIGATGARLTELWATDITVTNAISGSVTGNAGTVTDGVYTTGADTVYLTPTTAASTYQPLDTQLTSVAGLSYTGNGGKFMRVNAGETDFELATISGGGDALTSGGLTQFLGNNNWKVFYSDGSGDTQELSLGTSGQYLKSNGASSAPSWDTPAGGVTDGDKGDITVSGSGATWTIDNGVVSLAKMADMATASLIYRKTAGTGAPEVNTLATLKTDLGLTGTNSGDQTSIVGITGTKAQFDTAVTDGNFLYVGDVTQYTDELAQDAVGGILVDSSEIDFTYNDATPSITASIIAGSIDETKLDVSVNASLDLADTAVQPAGLTNYFLKTADDTDDITVGTTNKFATAAEKTKLGFISVTQAVDLDTIESDTATNNAKVSNATHTGDATGATALTVVAINSTNMAGLATGILKNTTATGVPSIAVAGDFPTLNQNTTGSAATLTTPRAIYGNNFDGSAALTQVIASTYGGTGNGFTKFTGPTTAEKTKTLRDATDTILELGGSYTPTGTWTSMTLVTPALGTPASGNLANCTFPTLNQNTSGSAATLTTTRTIWGQNFNGSANVTGTLALGTADLTLTGSVGATGARATKVWATDIESTNMPTVGGVSLSSTFQGLDTQLTSLAALTYAGNGGKFVRLNAGATDFEFATISGGGDLLASNNLSDVASATTSRNNILPSKTGNALKVLRVNAGETDYELATPSGGSGMSWTEVTGTSQTAAVNNGYIANNAALVTITLPTTAVVGDIVPIVGKGAGLWKVAQNASEIIHFGNQNTTTGTGGSLTATNRYDCLELICIVADTEWVVRSSVGNLTVV